MKQSKLYQLVGLFSLFFGLTQFASRIVNHPYFLKSIDLETSSTSYLFSKSILIYIEVGIEWLLIIGGILMLIKRQEIGRVTLIAAFALFMWTGIDFALHSNLPYWNDEVFWGEVEEVIEISKSQKISQLVLHLVQVSYLPVFIIAILARWKRDAPLMDNSDILDQP